MKVSEAIIKLKSISDDTIKIDSKLSVRDFIKIINSLDKQLELKEIFNCFSKYYETKIEQLSENN
jgi:hypothetical protein